GVGWFVRARVPQTPVFRRLSQRGEIAAHPFFDAVFRNPRNFLVAVGLKISEVSWVYILTVFVILYGSKNLGLPRQQLLNAISIAALLEVITIPLFGWLSDRIGRRALYVVGALFTVCFAFPLFWLLDTRDPHLVIITIVVALNLGHGTMFGLQSTYFPELFSTNVRYSGASVGFQLSAAIGGGLSPIIAATLVDRMGGTAGVSIMLIGLALITFVAVLFAPETKGKPLQA
ncbi:MAG TPA: MFS transporter, partial [Xanthobacteraceae bacterium]|nr:MFS transporter [Xanthobacteraceae bacterium]